MDVPTVTPTEVLVDEMIAEPTVTPKEGAEEIKNEDADFTEEEIKAIIVEVLEMDLSIEYEDPREGVLNIIPLRDYTPKQMCQIICYLLPDYVSQLESGQREAGSFNSVPFNAYRVRII